jgi:hypothetical protein
MMKTNIKIIALFTMGLLLFSCSQDELNEEIEATATPDSSLSKTASASTLTNWSFDNLNGWVDATQVGNPNYFLENGHLNIFTNPNSWDRTKIKTTTTYSTGTYTWRIFVPAMGEGDMASIGAFLYNNDTHELDFEIGYGKQIIRNELNAAADDLIVYMTSQANPFQSYATKIKRDQWHTFSMELTLNSNRRYQVNWRINGGLASTAQLGYGSKTKFKIFCSLENLTFIGEHIPTIQNYALFDFVEYNSK